jgi:hypothetical protein
MKRVNFNMDAECHAILKGVCALKRVTISEYIYEIIREDFEKQVREDNQVQTLFLAGQYKEGSNAYLLKESLIEERNQSNDSPA